MASPGEVNERPTTQSGLEAWLGVLPGLERPLAHPPQGPLASACMHLETKEHTARGHAPTLGRSDTQFFPGQCHMAARLNPGSVGLECVGACASAQDPRAREGCRGSLSCSIRNKEKALFLIMSRTAVFLLISAQFSWFCSLRPQK